MATFKMDPETMRERAASYTQEAENMQNVISAMDTLKNQLMTEWEGTASATYLEKMEELAPAFAKARDLIDDIAKSLTAGANMTEEAENTIAQQYQ